MRVIFANNRLRQCFENYNQAQREWDVAVAKKYIQRITWIVNADNFNDLRQIRSLRLHQLSGQRAGQFAVDLNNRWRIILVYDENQDTVHILEVINHYGD